MNTVNRKSGEHAHHFKDAAHEFDASKMGIWVFLCTEVLMFGGLFVVYAIFSKMYPEAWAEGAQFLNWKLGALNTVVLLLSSFTMAIGIYYAQRADNVKCSRYLWLTVALGLLFMLIKAYEYKHKFDIGIFPGDFFAYEGGQSSQLALYFSVYFCMTGLHAIHVLTGIGLISWVARRAQKNKEFNENYYTPVEVVGLFWHLVDLIWIYLFPLLYLID